MFFLNVNLIKVKKLAKSNIHFTSNDFAEIADIVYSERSPRHNFNKLKRKVVDISDDPNFLCMTTNLIDFKISDNSVVFCNTNELDNLFYHLKKINELKNITLITHQTDQLITKTLYEKKPKSILNWYSVNVDYKTENLHPIPIGLASDFSLKNLTRESFDDLLIGNFKKTNTDLYLNFNINTNFKERQRIEKLFKNKKYAKIDLENPNKDRYLNNIKKFGFVLCPWGNGVDTHRLWETLYAGSIPVTKWHYTYKCTEGLPVLFVERYEDINEDLLTTFMNSLNVQNYNFEPLTKNYWVNKIKNNSEMGREFYVSENSFETLLFRYKKNILRLVNSSFKRIITIINKLYKKLLS